MLCGPRRGCTEQPSGPAASQPACAAGTHSACRTVQIADVASSKCAASGRARRRHPSRAAAIASAASTLSGFSRTRRNIPVAYGAYRDAVAGRERPADVASLRHVLAPAPVAVVGAGGNPARTTRRRLPAPTAVTSGPGARCGTQSTACGPSGSCWWRTASMATTPPPPTTGTSSTSPGSAPDLGVGSAASPGTWAMATRCWNTWRLRGPPGRQVGTAARAGRQEGNRGALYPAGRRT